MASSISIVGKPDADTQASVQGSCKTDDVRLAAALLAMGVAPEFKQVGMKVVRLDRPGNWQEFFFEPKSACGKWSTKDLLDAWHEGLPWIEKHPDHPFAYIMAAMANHRDLGRYLARGNEFAFLRKGRSVAMLPTDASAGLEEKILGNF